MVSDPTHIAVIDYLKNLGDKKILDAGAGEGALSAAMKKAGHDVEACDIDPIQFKADGIACKKVDLNAPWPYADASFDIVTAVEVIEHLENLFHLIRESRRTLKAGGRLILTTPNIINIFSRLKFLLTGTFFCFGKEERKSGHINPLTFWEIKESLERSGFKILDIWANQFFGLGGEDTRGLVFKRLFAKLSYILIKPILRPADKKILAADNLIFIAKKV